MRGAIALGASFALVAGCVSLGPPPEPARYYVLDAEADSPEAVRPALPALGIGPVRLPPYLDRPEIVTRVGQGRLEVASADRWAAPLEDLFTSALGEDLRATTPAREIVTWPWPLGSSPEWSISVEVQRFEGEPGGAAVLQARWVVRRADAVATKGTTNARERGGSADVAGTVAALNTTIAVLARDVAAALDASRNGAPATPR